MSGYVLVTTPTEHVPRLRGLFRDEETTVLPLPQGRSLVYVSNSATVTSTAIFQGYSIDHEAETMAFVGADEEHLPHPSRPLEGSYFTARLDDCGVECGADLFGFVAMAWFSDPLVSAISDSYLSLIAIRRALGLPCRPHEETIRGRMWLNSMGLQQLGRETYGAGVRFATPGTRLRFEHKSGMLSETPLDLVGRYTGVFDTHAEAVTVSAQRMVRTIMTYAAAGGLVSLGLSGGTDSRLCLAATLAADIGDQLHIASTKNASADYAVASELGSTFGFEVNAPSRHIQGRLRQNDLAQGWAASSLGLYDALYMPRAFRERDVPVFTVGGQGAEVSKGNYGWRPLARITMPPDALRQARSGLAAIGVSTGDRWESEWHYLGFRNPLHSGRANLSSDYVARPAAQVPPVGLSRSDVNELPAPGHGAPNVILDAIIKINPKLALHPFDSASKNVSSQFVAERLDSVGGPLEIGRLSPYMIAGSPQPAHGVTGSQLDIARGRGFTGDLTPRSLLPLAGAMIEQFAELVPADVRQRLDELDPASTVRLPAAAREAGAIGTLLALTTVA